MNITFISDTHNLHEKLNPYLPGGDILVHCGDVTTHGTRKELFDFLKWFDSLNYECKMFVGGNHDFCLDPTKAIDWVSYAELYSWYACIKYLNNEYWMIDDVLFYGHSYTPMFQNMAFNCNEEELKSWDARIMGTTNVLVTHGPPYKILDFTDNREYVGSKSLLNRVKVVKPKIHAFGHIHEAYGMISFDDDTTFINASNHTWLWKGTPYQPPITIEI